MLAPKCSWQTHGSICTTHNKYPLQEYLWKGGTQTMPSTTLAIYVLIGAVLIIAYAAYTTLR